MEQVDVRQILQVLRGSADAQAQMVAAGKRMDENIKQLHRRIAELEARVEQLETERSPKIANDR